MGINKAVFSGSILHSPQFRRTSGGTPVLDMTIVVVDRHWNAATQTWESISTLVDCMMFGPRAVLFAERLRRGMEVVVQGSLRQMRWERDGHSRAKLEVVVEEIISIGDQEDGGTSRLASDEKR